MMLRTKEELKREIRDYLVNCTDENFHIEDVIRSGIIEEMNDVTENIDEALSELESENIITSQNVSFSLYLPKNEKGNNILKNLSKEELISYSPIWFYILSLFILGVTSKYFLTNLLPDNLTNTSLLSAYKFGFEQSIGFSAVVGVLGALILHDFASRLKRWRIISPEIYTDINNVVRNIVFITGIVWGLLRLIEENYEFTISNELITIIPIAMAVAALYSKIKTDRMKTVS